MQVCSFHNFFTIFMCFCTILLTFLAPVTAAARRLRVRSTRVKISYAARALPLHFRSASEDVSVDTELTREGQDTRGAHRPPLASPHDPQRARYRWRRP